VTEGVAGGGREAKRERERERCAFCDGRGGVEKRRARDVRVRGVWRIKIFSLVVAGKL